MIQIHILMASYTVCAECKTMIWGEYWLKSQYFAISARNKSENPKDFYIFRIPLKMRTFSPYIPKQGVCPVMSQQGCKGWTATKGEHSH